MLTSVREMRLDSGKDIRIIPDTVPQRIRANYGWILTQITPEELIHLIMEIPEQEEQQAEIVNIQYNIQNTRNSLTTIINQIINRLSLCQTASFTYCDTVYVENMLRKIGIRNPSEFIRKVQQMEKADVERKKLQVMYQDTKELQREWKRWLETNEKETEIREYLDWKKEEPKNYFLQDSIYQRLQTAGLTNKLSKIYQSNETVRMDWQSLHLAEQKQSRELILLEKEQENAWIPGQEHSCEQRNSFEYVETDLEQTLGQPRQITKQSLYCQMAAAILFQLTNKFFYEKLEKETTGYSKGGFFSRQKWIEITEKACSSASTSLERFWFYHREGITQQVFRENWQKETYDTYQKEIACMELLEQHDLEGIKEFLQKEITRYSQLKTQEQSAPNHEMEHHNHEMEHNQQKILNEEVAHNQQAIWRQELQLKNHKTKRQELEVWNKDTQNQEIEIQKQEVQSQKEELYQQKILKEEKELHQKKILKEEKELHQKKTLKEEKELHHQKTLKEEKELQQQKKLNQEAELYQQKTLNQEAELYQQRVLNQEAELHHRKTLDQETEFHQQKTLHQETQGQKIERQNLEIQSRETKLHHQELLNEKKESRQQELLNEEKEHRQQEIQSRGIEHYQQEIQSNEIEFYQQKTLNEGIELLQQNFLGQEIERNSQEVQSHEAELQNQKAVRKDQEVQQQKLEVPVEKTPTIEQDNSKKKERNRQLVNRKNKEQSKELENRKKKESVRKRKSLKEISLQLKNWKQGALNRSPRSEESRNQRIKNVKMEHAQWEPERYHPEYSQTEIKEQKQEIQSIEEIQRKWENQIAVEPKRVIGQLEEIIQELESRKGTERSHEPENPDIQDEENSQWDSEPLEWRTKKDTKLKNCLDQINEENLRRYEIWKKRKDQEKSKIDRYEPDIEKIHSQALKLLNQNEEEEEKPVVFTQPEESPVTYGEEEIPETLQKKFSALREEVNTEEKDIFKLLTEFQHMQKEEKAASIPHPQIKEKEKLGLIYRETIQQIQQKEKEKEKEKADTVRKETQLTEIHHTQEHRQQFTEKAKEWKREVMQEQEKQLERMVETKVQQKIQQQVNELTDKVYGKLERRLKGEKKRRGY